MQLFRARRGVGFFVPKRYWISTFRSVKDRERFADYVQRAVPIVEAAGARFVVKNMPKKVYEAGINELAVVLEFESTDAAIAMYESAAYQDALKILGDAVEREIRIVEDSSSFRSSPAARIAFRK